MHTCELQQNTSPDTITLVLPGPTRKRTPHAYRVRLTYRNPSPHDPGCALLWEVEGGRLVYQIAMERRDDGGLRWHCTCADAVYRGENQPHLCKHVRGLISLGRSDGLAGQSGSVPGSAT